MIQIHEICGYSLCVKSPYEKDMMECYRGKNAGYRFLAHIQALSKDLKKKIGNANAKMIFNKEDKEKFENAKQCHICEGDIKTTKIDHLENIHQWLQTMRLHNSFPSEKEVQDRIYNPNLKIDEQKFDEAKQNLLKYLKEHKNIIVRYHYH